MSEQREVQIYDHDSDPVESVHRVGRSLLLFTGSAFSIFFLGFTIYLLEIVKQWFFILSYIALAGAGVVIVCVVLAPVILLLRWLFYGTAHDVGPNGLAFRGLFGRVDTVAPMNAGAIRYAQEKKSGKKEAPTPQLLSMLQLIEQGIIGPGQTKVIQGYTLKGELIIRDRANTTAIGGRGGSGKSRRAILAIGQDVISLAPLLPLGAKIVVCDPHGLGKKDALSKLLEPLAPWLVFARTEEEIEREARAFIDEYERRIVNESVFRMGDGDYIPWAIYFDELPRLMDANKYSESCREAVQQCINYCGDEYRGVQGYCTILGQKWTDKDCGGTNVRRAVAEVLMHQISMDYAKFFFPAKWYKRADVLPVRNCIYKDKQGEIQEIITPPVTDDTPMKLAEIMQELCPVEIAPTGAGQPTREIPESLARPKNPGEPPAYTSYRRRNTDTLPEQMAQYPGYANTPLLLSPSYGERYPSDFEHTQDTQEMGVNEDETEVNTLPGRGETTVNSKQVEGETFVAQVNTAKPVSPALAFTPEQEILVLNAAFQVTRENGGRITRSDIMEKLGWTRAQWPVIKGVCDKHNIAKQ